MATCFIPEVINSRQWSILSENKSKEATTREIDAISLTIIGRHILHILL